MRIAWSRWAVDTVRKNRHGTLAAGPTEGSCRRSCSSSAAGRATTRRRYCIYQVPRAPAGDAATRRTDDDSSRSSRREERGHGAFDRFWALLNHECLPALEAVRRNCPTREEYRVSLGIRSGTENWDRRLKIQCCLDALGGDARWPFARHPASEMAVC